jgi:hypothetical protein
MRGLSVGSHVKQIIEEFEGKAKECTPVVDGETFDVRYKRVQTYLNAFQRFVAHNSSARARL